MKIKNIYLLLLTALSMLFTNGLEATHLIGGYMNYEYLAPSRDSSKHVFKIMLTMFRDVEQSDVDFDDQIELGVYLNNADKDINRRFLVDLQYRVNVKPPGSEECDYYADKQIEMGYYEVNITLDNYAPGYYLYFVRCCRNKQDNLINDQGSPFQGQTYMCFIPNPALRNSSPFFSGVPSPYMCSLDTNTFLNRAIDKDGDSLVYKFVWPWQGGKATQGGSKPTPPDNLSLPIEQVIYENAHSFNRPFGNGDFIDIDQSNGLTTLYAPKPGSYVIAIEVIEYRNGIELSRVRLDMQILVLDCPPNNQPQINSNQGSFFEIEAGEELCFFVQGTDIDINDELTLSMTGDILTGRNGVNPPLATFTETTGRRNVSGEFCWTPSCEQAKDKNYVVVGQLIDDGCPAKFDNINIEIKVNKFQGSQEIIGPDDACAGSPDLINYSALAPRQNSIFYWEVDGGNIEGDPELSSIDIVWNSNESVGRIKMVEISEFGCPSDTVVKLVNLLPSPDPPAINGTDTLCEGSMDIQYSINRNPSSSYEWFIDGGLITATNPDNVLANWPTKGDQRIGAIEISSNGCISDTFWFDVNVRKPLPSVIGPRSVCPNSVDLEYTSSGESSSTYTWQITGGSQTGGGTSDRILVTWGNEGAGLVEVVEVDRFGCSSIPVLLPIDKTYNLAGFQPEGLDEVCEFDFGVPYNVIASNGSIYRWFVGGGLQASGDSTNAVTVNWGATGAGTVGVQQRAYDAVNDRECLSPIVNLNVTIHPLPTADEIIGDMDLCQTTELTNYSINGFAGSTYHWELDGDSSNIIGQGSNTVQIPWDAAGSYNLRVRETSINNCPGEWIDTVIVVRPLPNATDIVGDFVFCFPDINQKRYYINGLANSTYQWFVDGATNFSISGDTLIVDWNDQGFGNIRGVEVTEYGCTNDTLELQIYVNNISIDFHVASVGFPDNFTHGHWGFPRDSVLGSKPIVEYRLAGSESTWNTVDQSGKFRMTHKDINTDENRYEYRARTTDLCGNPAVSEIHIPVQLNGVQNEDDFSVALDFTEYVGWENGVEYYEIYQRVNQEVSFNPIGTVSADGSQNFSFIATSSPEVYGQCFRVKSYELGGETEVSWSNEICFFFSPNVYVPNAFTPNKDNMNDGFKPVAVAVDSFEMQIFNRWGERVYYSLDQDASWDGTFMQADAQSGVYAYLLFFTDYSGKQYKRSGTIHLLR